MSAKPDMTRFLRTSQPMPPAPTTNTLLDFIFSCKTGTNTPATEAAMFAIFWARFDKWNVWDWQMKQMDDAKLNYSGNTAIVYHQNCTYFGLKQTNTQRQIYVFRRSKLRQWLLGASHEMNGANSLTFPPLFAGVRINGILGYRSHNRRKMAQHTNNTPFIVLRLNLIRCETMGFNIKFRYRFIHFWFFLSNNSIVFYIQNWLLYIFYLSSTGPQQRVPIVTWLRGWFWHIDVE